jgi:hypothetical protein
MPTATIETLYHAVAILSCRFKNWEDLQRSSTSYLRQSLSSLRVTATICRESRDQLVLFPFVPYAVSLSLSIAYREMRYNKVSMYRARARAQFQKSCDALEELGEVFWSASTMAEMGKATLREMDRVFSTVAASEQQRVYQGIQKSTNYETLNADDSSCQTPHTEIQGTQYGQFQDFDPSLFDAVSDLDLFGMFDPSFDLNGIDACLEGNLDLSFPTQF